MVLAHRAHEVGGIGYPHAVLCVLHIVVDIDSRIFHLSERLYLVDIAEVRHETMRDKLIRTLVFVHNIYLPVEEVGSHLAVPSFPPQFVGRVGNTFAVVEIVPCVDVHAPVVESPTTVKRVEIVVKRFADIVTKSLEIVLVIYTTRLHLVVYLIAYNSRLLCEMLHHLADDTLAISTVSGIIDIHVLPYAIIALAVVNSM